MRDSASTAPIEPPRAPMFERVVVDTGHKVVDFGHGVVRFIGFLGETLVAIGAAVRPSPSGSAAAR